MDSRKSFKNILLFKPGAIGDLLQITPVIRRLNGIFPDAKISVMVGNNGTVALFRNNPAVHEVLVFDRKGEHASFSSFIDLWKAVRNRSFDLVINFQRSNIKGWLLLSAAFPAHYLVYHKARNRAVHAVTNHLETLSPLGDIQPEQFLELCFIPGQDAETEAEKMLAAHKKSGKTLVALNPGASHPVNRWSTNAFAELSDLLQADGETIVVLIGGGDDRVLADEIISKVRYPAIDFTGKCSIEVTGAVLKACDLLVSGDTGPMHLAAAVGTPVVALFGAADPARTGPVGDGHMILQSKELSCVPCCSRNCQRKHYLECMELITPFDVYAAVRTIQGAKRV